MSDTSSPNLFFKGKQRILCYTLPQQRAKIAPHWKVQFYRQRTGMEARKQRISLILCGYMEYSICVSRNKACPKIQRAKLDTLVHHTDQAAVAHAFNPTAMLTSHRGQVVLVHAFNLSTREENKAGRQELVRFSV